MSKGVGTLSLGALPRSDAVKLTVSLPVELKAQLMTTLRCTAGYTTFRWMQLHWFPTCLRHSLRGIADSKH